jgi:hypothetical protein
MSPFIIKPDLLEDLPPIRPQVHGVHKHLFFAVMKPAGPDTQGTAHGKSYGPLQKAFPNRPHQPAYVVGLCSFESFYGRTKVIRLNTAVGIHSDDDVACR